MSGYDVAFTHHLSKCGWVYEVRRIERPLGVHLSIPLWRKGERDMFVDWMDEVLRDHRWCRPHVERALEAGAVGFRVVITDGPDGEWNAHLIPEWQDAVTRLGEVT